MDYQRFFSIKAKLLVSKTQQAIGVKVHEVEAAGAGPVAVLSQGLPNPEYFPIKALNFTLRNGLNVSFDTNELRLAQQYSLTGGQQPCRDMCRGLVKEFHNPPTWDRPLLEGGTDVVVTSGNMNSNFTVFSLLLNPGDYILTDIYQYSGIVSQMKGLNLRPLAIDMDKDGIIPESLSQTLSRWRPEDAQDPNSDIPRLLVTVPNHSNPTGSVLSLERKQEIYSIAQKYNLLIYEDDVYYFVNFEDVDPLPSFLSMDTDGRVIRADSFAKIIAPGFRLGYISGPGPIMAKYVHYHMSSTVGASSMSQMMVTRIIKELGIAEFKEEMKSMSQHYKIRRDVMVEALNEHMIGLATWDVPVGGYFLWLKIPKLQIDPSHLFDLLLEEKVAIVPGTYFIPAGAPVTVPTIRLAFSIATIDDIKEGVRRISVLLKANTGK